MKTYVLLLRGINVGGKNKIAMAELKSQLEIMGCQAVTTYINSGNVVLKSDLTAEQLGTQIEKLLPQKFKLDSSIIKVLVLNDTQFRQTVDQAPKDFGKDNEKHRYYVLFLMGISSTEAMRQIEARPEIDTVWAGDHAIYFRFPSVKSPDATKSYLNKIVAKPIYQQITMRNWNTTLKIADMIEAEPKT